jgi:UPF0176 protein
LQREPMLLNLNFYKFVLLQDPEFVKAQLLTFLHKQKHCRGTILLAFEGINGSLAGPETAMRAIQKFFLAQAAFSDMEFKESYSDHQPFSRLFVKIKKEIVTMGVPEINPAETPAPSMEPKMLKDWLDKKMDFTLLDTRNDYEVKLGTFSSAADLAIESFRDFPEKAKTISPELKSRPIVMFCTGGIRCEKAAPLLRQLGFEQVYQLEGGILNYFKECGGAHWEGECFVFDQRIALNPELAQTGATICPTCQYPMPKQIEKCTNCL